MPSHTSTEAPLPELTGEYVAYLSLWRYVTFYSFLSGICATGVAYIAFARHPSVASGPVWVWLITFAVYYGLPFTLVVFVALLAVRFGGRIRLNANGVHAFSLWGKPIWMRWEEIERVERRRFATQPCLILHSSAAPQPIWIVLLMDDLPQVRDYVVRHAGRENPLARWLAENVR